MNKLVSMATVAALALPALVSAGDEPYTTCKKEDGEYVCTTHATTGFEFSGTGDTRDDARDAAIDRCVSATGSYSACD